MVVMARNLQDVQLERTVRCGTLLFIFVPKEVWVQGKISFDRSEMRGAPCMHPAASVCPDTPACSCPGPSSWRKNEPFSPKSPFPCALESSLAQQRLAAARTGRAGGDGAARAPRWRCALIVSLQQLPQLVPLEDNLMKMAAYYRA